MHVADRVRIRSKAHQGHDAQDDGDEAHRRSCVHDGHAVKLQAWWSQAPRELAHGAGLAQLVELGQAKTRGRVQVRAPVNNEIRRLRHAGVGGGGGNAVGCATGATEFPRA
eukprot:scaffold47_cov258-Pinguiococcus_pyrenoidosus.AAC.28